MTATPPLRTDAFLRALDAARTPKGLARARKVLAPFESFQFDTQALDGEAVAAHVSARWEDVVALAAHDDERVRHAAVWALGLSGDARAVDPVLRVLTHQRDHYDHDLAYMAFGRLGAVAIAGLRTHALQGEGDVHTQAVCALGYLHGAPREVVEVLDEVVRARGQSAAVQGAIYNLHLVEALPLALGGVADEASRFDAVGAVHECLRVARESGALASVDGEAVGRALGPLFDDPRMGTMPEDPWASMFPWGLESLAWVRHPRGREVALRVLADDTERAARLAALLALRAYPLDAAVLKATRGLLTSREAELRGAAALVLRRADDRTLRAKAESVLVQRVARPGRHDADWYEVVETLAGDDAAVDRWIKVWATTTVRDVRGRLVRALMTTVHARGDGAQDALAALRGRCPPALSRTLLAHWKRSRGLQG